MFEKTVWPAGTKVLIGAPANPLPAAITSGITQLTGAVDGILEAHLPHCFAEGVMEAAAQVLIVVVGNQAATESIAAQLSDGLASIIPAGDYLDVKYMTPDDPLLAAVRSAGCQLPSAMDDYWK